MTSRGRPGVVRLAGLAFVFLALAPASSFGHAVLKETSPARGTTAKSQPEEIAFRFSEPVEAKFGAIQVYDAEGGRVEEGEAKHPGGRGADLAIGLKPGLPDGTYTATFRVISADGHPVSGGFVFSIGKPGAAPSASVSKLVDKAESGTATGIAFGVARGLQYAALAMAVGGAFFLYGVWLPALGLVAGAGADWRAASEAFASRLRALMIIVVAIGVVSGAAGVVLQGATAAGVSFWSALDSRILIDVLGTRLGSVWGVRILVWLAVGVLVLALARRHARVLRPATVGATGLAPARLSGPAMVLLAVPLGFLAVSPSLSGHPSVQEPTEVLFPANVVHVVAISVWIAGLALLLLALPVATRRLREPTDRTRLLAATAARFSTVAGVAVAILLASGLVQAFFEVRTLDNLVGTAFGRAVLIKFALFVALVAIGAYNRRRLVPWLKRIAAGGEAPGRAGLTLRRAVRAEVALVVAVLGVTSALVSYAPSVAVETGPVSVTKALGPAEAQLTVDPAQVGRNEMHVYLLNPRDGTQYDLAKDFSVSLVLPDKNVGPLDVTARKGGPGHYVIDDAVFGLAGGWQVKMRARVSDFEAHEATIQVPIR